VLNPIRSEDDAFRALIYVLIFAVAVTVVVLLVRALT